MIILMIKMIIIIVLICGNDMIIMIKLIMKCVIW